MSDVLLRPPHEIHTGLVGIPVRVTLPHQEPHCGEGIKERRSSPQAGRGLSRHILRGMRTAPKGGEDSQLHPRMERTGLPVGAGHLEEASAVQVSFIIPLPWVSFPWRRLPSSRLFSFSSCSWRLSPQRVVHFLCFPSLASSSSWPSSLLVGGLLVLGVNGGQTPVGSRTFAFRADNGVRAAAVPSIPWRPVRPVAFPFSSARFPLALADPLRF